MLLREDGTERPADPLGQPGIPLAALEEAPRIAAAGNHLADLEAGFRHQKGSRRPKGAALGNQAQDPAFDGEPTARRLRCGKPGKTLARQHDGPSFFARDDENLVEGTGQAGATQRLAGHLRRQIADIMRHLHPSSRAPSSRS